MKKTFLAAALAFAPIPAHANYIEIVNGEVMLGIGLPHITSGTFDLADPDWSFENDPNWGTEIVPCPLVPWIASEYLAWEETKTKTTTYLSPVDPLPFVNTPLEVCGPNCGPTPMVSVPEPASWLLFAIGMMAIGFSMFRQRLATVSQWRRV